MYRDADFDINYDARSTASCFVGLKEESRFLPNAHPKIRRTSSVDDVSRFQRHYKLAKRHCGRALTWRHYATMLHEGFRYFKAPKMKSVHTVCSTSTISERSAYTTALDSEGSSYYSMKKVMALSNLKRCCLQISSETRHLARELVKRVDKVLHLHQPRGTTPPPKKNRQAKTTGDTNPFFRFGSPRARGSMEVTSSDSTTTSTSSIRPPCGAGDSGKRKIASRIERRYQKRQ